MLGKVADKTRSPDRWGQRPVTEIDCPLDKRCLVLNHRHIEDLILFDTKAFKDITDFVNGQPKRFAGFNILQFTKTAIFNRTTMQKKLLVQ